MFVPADLAGKGLRRTILPRAIFLVVLTLCGGTLVAAPGPTASLSPGEFTIHVEGERISLRAQDGPLHEVVSQLGKALGVSIEALNLEHETVTTAFNDLPLEAAMQRLSRRVIYVHADHGDGVTKIVLLPEGEKGPILPSETAEDTAPKPFRFEFDPSE